MNVVPKEYVAESVVTSLRRKVKGKRVLLARAKVARDVIPRELRKLGARVDVVEAYETSSPDLPGNDCGGAEIPEVTAPRDCVYEFFYGEEFCGAAGKKPRGSGRSHRPNRSECDLLPLGR